MDTPIRVLHVVVNMNLGGAETLIMNLYRNIDRSLVQFDFLTNRHGIFDAEIEAMGGKVHRIPYITDSGPFKYSKALESFFTIHQEYKIVHSHLDKMSGLVVRAAKKAGIPVRIAHSHNTSSEGNVLVKGIKWVSGLFINRNATEYLACSEVASKWLFKRQANKARVLKNGIDSRNFKYMPEKNQIIRNLYDIKQDQLVIGHVGRFCHQKNHTFLIDIFSKILEINPNAILVLVGDGPLKEKIKRKVSDLGILSNVLFLGIRNNINDLLQAFDCMVFPSHHEGLPVALIEAQSVGLPCLISDRITSEVDIGAGLIQYENLKMSPLTWATKTLLFEASKKDTSSFIRSHGYDIQQSTTWLQQYYMTKANGHLSSLRKVKIG